MFGRDLFVIPENNSKEFEILNKGVNLDLKKSFYLLSLLHKVDWWLRVGHLQMSLFLE